MAVKPAFLTLPGGLAEIPAALAQRLSGIDLRLNTSLDRLDTDPAGGYQIILDSGEILHVDAVLLALPAYVSARLTQI